MNSNKPARLCMGRSQSLLSVQPKKASGAAEKQVLSSEALFGFGSRHFKRIFLLFGCSFLNVNRSADMLG